VLPRTRYGMSPGSVFFAMGFSLSEHSVFFLSRIRYVTG